MVRLAFIGVGGIAGSHLGNLKKMTDVSVVAVCDLDQGRAEKVAADLGSRAYTDAAAMLKEVEVDGVYICLPPFAHGEAERLALEHNLPFYVEKPLSVDPGLPEEIAQEVDRKGLIAAVGFQLRYSSAATELRQRLAGRTLAMANGHYLCPLVGTPWWRQQAKSGGQIVEQTIHIVDMMRYLTGDEVASVFTAAATRVHGDVPNLDIADVHSISLRFRSGAVGNLVSSCALPSGWHSGIDIVADGMFARYSASGGRSTITTPEGEITVTDGDRSAMATADRAFVDAIRHGDGSRLRSTYADALHTHRLVMAIVRSAQSGKPEEIA